MMASPAATFACVLSSALCIWYTMKYVMAAMVSPVIISFVLSFWRSAIFPQSKFWPSVEAIMFSVPSSAVLVTVCMSVNR